MRRTTLLATGLASLVLACSEQPSEPYDAGLDTQNDAGYTDTSFSDTQDVGVLDTSHTDAQSPDVTRYTLPSQDSGAQQAPNSPLPNPEGTPSCPDPNVTYQDTDGDGQGNPLEPLFSCQPQTFNPPIDCDDTDPTVMDVTLQLERCNDDQSLLERYCDQGQWIESCSVPATTFTHEISGIAIPEELEPLIATVYDRHEITGETLEETPTLDFGGSETATYAITIDDQAVGRFVIATTQPFTATQNSELVSQSRSRIEISAQAVNLVADEEIHLQNQTDPVEPGEETSLHYNIDWITAQHGVIGVYNKEGTEPFNLAQTAHLFDQVAQDVARITGVQPRYATLLVPTPLSSAIGIDNGYYTADTIMLNYVNEAWVERDPQRVVGTFAHEYTHQGQNDKGFTRFYSNSSFFSEGMADAVAFTLGYKTEIPGHPTPPEPGCSDYAGTAHPLGRCIIAQLHDQERLTPQALREVHANDGSAIPFDLETFACYENWRPDECRESIPINLYTCVEDLSSDECQVELTLALSPFFEGDQEQTRNFVRDYVQL